MPHRATLRPVLRLAFALALIAGFWLALQPPPATPVWVAWQDKVEHLAFFAALALLGLAGWPSRAKALAGGLLAYGLAMEIAQSFTPHRRGDPWDWLADALGIATALLLAHALRRNRREHRSTAARSDT